jgi:hypothetical protein
LLRVCSLLPGKKAKKQNAKSDTEGEETAKAENDGDGRLALLQFFGPAKGNCRLEGFCGVGAAITLFVDPGCLEQRSGQAESELEQ